jgi:H-type lectin domain.
MRKLRNHLVGIDQGQVMLFADFQDDGPMWTGTGPREARRSVTFAEPFRSPPAVQVTMSLFDMDQKTNQRADLTAEAVTEHGMEIVFRTWGDTRVARVRAAWMAIGEVYHPDDWDEVE